MRWPPRRNLGASHLPTLSGSQALAVLLQVREARLAHEAKRHHSPGDADPHVGFQILGKHGAEPGEDLGYGVREVEAPPISPIAESFDFATSDDVTTESPIGTFRQDDQEDFIV